MRRIFTAALLALACAGSPKGTAPAPAACGSSDSLMVRTELYMGRNVPGGGEVSDEAWKQFLADVVTPRFPGGFSVAEMSGQWRGASGQVERERAMMFSVFHRDDAVSARALDEIAAEYKRRFKQEAVLRARGPACIRFHDGA